MTNDPASVLDKAKVDLVVIATTSWTKEQMPDLSKILSAGINCISIAEEMAAPEAQSPELAAELDALAKRARRLDPRDRRQPRLRPRPARRRRSPASATAWSGSRRAA